MVVYHYHYHVPHSCMFLYMYTYTQNCPTFFFYIHVDWTVGSHTAVVLMKTSSVESKATRNGTGNILLIDWFSLIVILSFIFLSLDTLFLLR
jgi:hypothetical protein